MPAAHTPKPPQPASALDKPVCGATRPGWDHPDASPLNRLPCVLAVEHERDGEPLHRDALAQYWFGSDILEAALGLDLAAEYLRATVEQETPR